MANKKKRDEGRRINNERDQRGKLTYDELMERYGEASRFTAGTCFGVGSGILGKAARDEVIRRSQEREQEDEAKKFRKKKYWCDLKAEVLNIKYEMLTNENFSWTVNKLKQMIKWKKVKEDGPMPQSKKDCLERYETTKNRRSPHVSPMNLECEWDMQPHQSDESD